MPPAASPPARPAAAKPAPAAAPINTKPRPADVAAHRAAQAGTGMPSFINDGLSALAGDGPARRESAPASRTQAPAPAAPAKPATRPVQKEIVLGHRSMGPDYRTPPGNTDEAMRGGQADEQQAGGEETTAHEPPPPASLETDPLHARPDQMPPDSLADLEDIAGLAPTEQPAAPPNPPVAASDAASDADLDAEVQALGPLKAVRDAHKAKLKENRALKAEQTKLSTQLAETAARLKRYETGEEVGLPDKLAEAQTRLTEYESRIKTLDYTQSHEFQDSYVQPLAKALEQAYAEVEQLPVNDGDSTRPATQADFNRILRMEPAAARKAAGEMFGEMAPDVWDHVRGIKQLDRKRQEALSNASKLAVEAEKVQSTQVDAYQQEFDRTYQTSISEIAERIPDIFKERDGDTEGNELLAKGRSMIENAIKQAPSMKADARARVAAQIHLRAANFGRALLDLKRARDENTALRKQLEEFEASKPGGGMPNGHRVEVTTDPTDPNYSWEKNLESMARPT